MGMSITVRLGEELEDFLEKESKVEGTTKSEIIRNCITEYYHAKYNGKTAWELGEEYFGLEGSGDPNHAENRKSILRNYKNRDHRQGLLHLQNERH